MKICSVHHCYHGDCFYLIMAHIVKGNPACSVTHSLMLDGSHCRQRATFIFIHFLDFLRR